MGIGDMAKSFEGKLTEASSEETLKAAKQLLKNASLFCAWRDGEGKINAKFLDRNTQIHTRVAPGDSNEFECACRDAGGKLCEHAVATLMHFGKYKLLDLKPIDDGVSNYAGLKYESLGMLADREREAAAAHVRLEALSAFPHVPSKWENASLSVKLCGNDREYLGNVNNLRQLFFDKTLSISLKLADFSLQDQQIIRFLAINGEPDNSCVLLNSEQTAEFFHCLVNFDHFYREGRKLVIHGERCEAVILKKTAAGGAVSISPGILVEGVPLAIKSAKVITGRAGCWIGRQGEYFYLPATLDVGWLRNFFRTGEQKLDDKLSPSFLEAGKFPVPVVDVDSLEPARPPLQILLDGSFSGGQFRLLTRYLYDGAVLPVDSGRLFRAGGKFHQTDEVAELRFQRELELFGFFRSDRTFVLNDPEAAGTFIDQVLPIHLKSRTDLCFTAAFAALTNGGAGLPQLDLDCRVLETRRDGYLIRYRFRIDGLEFSFGELAAAIKLGRRYLSHPRAGMLAAIPKPIARFVPGTVNVVKELNEKDGTFFLPFFSSGYFLHLAAELPNARMPELYRSIVLTETRPPDFQFAGELRGYQQEGVRWMREMTENEFHVILADEMGLGKTVQVLALLAGAKRRASPPALIICPASLVTNWEREANRFVPGFRVAALAGAGRENVWETLGDYDLVITSYATSRRDSEEIRKHTFSYLILDEAQHIKNPGTVNAQSCKAIAAQSRIVLTGTPLENSTEDLWSIFDFLQPGLLGSFNSFKTYYANIRESRMLQADLAARVAPFMRRRTKAEVGQELPPKQESTLFCEMEPEQRKLYEAIRRQGRQQLARIAKGDTRANTEIFTTLLRLRQICCHPALLPDREGEKAPSAKFELLQELVLGHIDSGHKMLLFSQFTTFLARITDWLDAEDIRYEYLDGGTRNRQQRVDHFNSDPSVPLFLLSLKAGGTGLNLTAADTVVICDPWWNPAVELQAADRTHRIGQTRPVSSLKLLVKDSIEEKILALQARKQEIFDSLIENPSASFGDKLTIDDYKLLFS